MKWTAPADGAVTLRLTAQIAVPPPASETLAAVWPEPAYDDPKGLPPDQEIFLRNGSSGGASWEVGLILTPNRGGDSTLALGYLHAFSTNAFGEWTPIAQLDPYSYSSPPLPRQFHVRGGQVIFLSVQTYGYSLSDGFVSLRFTPTPTNDRFADRLPVLGVWASVKGHNIGATSEVGEPATPGRSGNTVWWTWTAPDHGNVFFTSAEDDEGFLLSVHKGTSLETLLPVGSTTNRIKLPAAAGETFQIAVDSQGETGEFGFSVFLDFLPPVIDPTASRRLEDGSFRLEARQLRGRPFSVVAVEDGNTEQVIWHGVINGERATFRDHGAATRSNVFYHLRLPREHRYGEDAAAP